MGETPDEIRDEIEETRGRMSETAEAIGYRADVKSRAKESIAEKKDAVVGSLSESRDAVVGKADSLVSRVGGVVPDAREVKQGAAKVGLSRENPLGLAAVGIAIGFVVGTLLPKTQAENRTLGPISDEVTDKAKEAAQESIERGKAVAQDAIDAAAQTVKERGEEEAQELSSSLKEKAQEVGRSE
jgi:hypothetical protein